MAMRACPAPARDPRVFRSAASTSRVVTSQCGVTRWVTPLVAPIARAGTSRRQVATFASDTSSDKSRANRHVSDPPAGADQARAKSNISRAKGGGDIRASRLHQIKACSVWRTPDAKAKAMRAEASRREGNAGADDGKSNADESGADEGKSNSGESSKAPPSSDRPDEKTRPRRARSTQQTVGAHSKQSKQNSSKDPFASLPKGALAADVEKELGRCVRELLRIEAMRNRLCEETIAQELRRDTPDDVFSKDFGKKSLAGNFRDTSTTGGTGEDTSGFQFKKKLAVALGYARGEKDDGVSELARNVTRGQAARRAFVTHNVGIAASVANDFWGKITPNDRGLLTRDELVLDGCAGLARAADRFDPDRGYKFSTYSFFWVRKAVVDGVNECGRTIRLPKYLFEKMRESRKVHNELTNQLGRPPTDEELAKSSSVDVERVREWRGWYQNPLSLDQNAPGVSMDGMGAGETLSDVVSVDGATQAQDELDNTPIAAAEADADADFLRSALDDAFATLLPRERFVLRHRFGLASASARAMEFDTAPSAAVLMTPEEVIAAAYAKAREKRDAAETAVAANANGDFRQSRFSVAQVRDDALKPKPTTAAGRLIKAANNALERADKIKAGGRGGGGALRAQGGRKSGGAKTSKKNKNEFMKGGYSAQEAEAIMTVDDFGGAATGASAVLLGSLMGVTAQTVRTIELRAIAKLKKPSRMGLVMPFVDKTTRDAIEQAAFGDEEFATALASAVERADERAGGGRVFGAFAGGAVASFGVSGGNTRGSETAPKKRRRSAQRRQAIGRQAKSKSTLKERGVARGDNAEATARDTVRKTATVRAV